MSTFWISLLATIGGSTWVYSKFYKITGGNNQKSIIGATVIGLVGFLIIYFTLSTFIK